MAVSIRCFATGAAQHNQEIPAIIVDNKFLFAVSRQVLRNPPPAERAADKHQREQFTHQLLAGWPGRAVRATVGTLPLVKCLHSKWSFSGCAHTPPNRSNRSSVIPFGAKQTPPLLNDQSLIGFWSD